MGDELMDPTSIKMPPWMAKEIETRREKGENRSEYIRDAVRARFQAEDEETWNFHGDEEEE